MSVRVTSQAKEEEELIPVTKKQPVKETKTQQQEELEDQLEKEKRDKAGNDLDDIEKIVANESGLCTNCILLAINVILIVQILVEYRISEVFGTISSIQKYIDLRVSADLNDFEKTSRIYDDYLYVIINNMHDHAKDRNNFSLLFNPLYEDTSEYNLTEYIFVESYNYYVGSIITLQLKHVKDAEADLLIRKIITLQNTNVRTISEMGLNGTKLQFVNKLSQTPTESQTEFLTIEENNEGFSVKLRFQNLMEQHEAIALLELIKDQFQLASLFHVEHQIYTINPITEVIVKTSKIFDTSIFGRIKYSSQPQYALYYYQDSNVQKNVAFSIAIKSIYAFILLVQILSSIGQRLFFTLIKFLSTRIIQIEMDLVLIIAQRTLNMIYVVLWFSAFLQFQSLNISPQATQAEFDSVDKFIDTFSTVQTFSIVTFIISIYDIIKIMTSFFPTFGVLLYTFDVAGKDILIFVSYTAMMLISFIIISNIIFGPSQAALGSFINATFFCFEFLSGQMKFAKLAEFDSIVGYIFALLFFIMFILILLPYLYGIIIYTYGILREKMQMHTQALAEIGADKSTAATMKWINLIFFLPPKTEEQLEKEKKQKEELKKQRLKELEQEKRNKNKKKKKPASNENQQGEIVKLTVTHSKIEYGTFTKTPNKRSNLKKTEVKDAITPTPNKASNLQPIKEETKQNETEEKELSFKEILAYNLQQLDLKNFLLSFIGLGQEDLQTKQQRIDEIQKKIKEIKERNAKQKADLKRLKEESLFTNLKDGFLHIIFLIFVIIGFQNQTIKSLTFEQEKYLSNYFNYTQFKSILEFQQERFTINQIEGTYQLNSFLTQLILQTAATSYANEFDSEQITNYDLIVGHSPIRITFRLYNNQIINYFTSNQDIKFRGRSSSDLSRTSGGHKDERQINLYIHGNEYRYSSPGSEDTSFKAGGFPFRFSQEISGAISKHTQLIVDNFFTISTALINIEFVIYNPPNDLYSFIDISLQMQGNGKIENSIQISNFPITLYSGERLTRIVFELIVLYFHYKFWIMFFRQWEIVWNHEDAADFTPFDLPKDKSFVERYLNLDLSDKKNSQIVNLLFAIAKRIHGFFARFATSLKLMVQQTFFNILLITGIIMMFVQIIYWLQITFNSFRMQYNFYDYLNNTNEPDSMFSDFQYLSSLFKLYNMMIAFILFNEMLRVMFYFSFSAKLSLVLDIIASASLDIIFFMIMFCLIIFAFAGIGVLAFGPEHEEFQTLIKSVIQCTGLFLGQTSMDKFDGEDYSLAQTLFYFLMNIILLLIFIRMLIAILDGHFQELMSDSTEERLGLVDTILSILRSEYKKLKESKEMDDGIITEEDEQEENIEDEENQEKYSKWAIVKYFQKKMREIQLFTEKLYKQGMQLFEKYRDLLFDTLFEQNKNQQKDDEQNASMNNQQNEDNALKVDLKFDDDDNAHYNKLRLETADEIQTYNPASQALNLLERYTGTKMKGQYLKTTQVNTWISSLEKGIQDVASTSLNFNSYYIPNSNKEKNWIKKFQFNDADKLYEDLAVELGADNMEQTLRGDQFDRYGGILKNKLLKLIGTFGKEDNYQEFVRVLEQYYLFFSNLVVVETPDQHLSRKKEVIASNNNTHRSSNRGVQQKLIQIEYDISLIDISLEIPFFESKEAVQFEQSVKQKPMKSIISKTKSLVQKQMTVKNSLGNKIKAEKLKILNSQQIINIFSKIGDLFVLWNNMKLNDKLYLWFGYNTQSKQFSQPQFEAYHKISFWNVAGWDKKTILKFPHVKYDILELEEDYQQIFNQEGGFLEEYNFIVLWKQFQKTRADIGSQQQLDNDNEAMENHISLPISQQQMAFAKYIIRGSDNLLGKLEEVGKFEEKLNILKKSHLYNEHKLIIWMLMSPIEKMELIIEQEQKHQAQFMILLFIEELYDNFMMLNKIEKDLTDRLNTNIYLMYHNFAEFNALATAVQLKQKYTQQSISDKQDYLNYIQFLEQQLTSSNQALSKCSDFLMQQLEIKKKRAMFSGAAMKIATEKQKEKHVQQKEQKSQQSSPASFREEDILNNRDQIDEEDRDYMLDQEQYEKLKQDDDNQFQ